MKDVRRGLLDLGSTGCHPVVLGSLPSTSAVRPMNSEFQLEYADSTRAAERLSAATGWHPVLPGFFSARILT